MSEYIKRDEAKDIFEEAWMDDWGLSATKDRLDEIPAADVVERKRGEWVEDYNIINDTYHFHCSVCGDEEWGTKEQMEDTRFCPNCGADMRKGGDT